MSYLKPVVVASTMLVASLSATAFADHMNYAATLQPQTAANMALAADRNSPKSDVSSFNWEKRITLGGLLNVDAVYSERGWADPGASLLLGSADFDTPPFSSESVRGSDIVVNNANLFLDAKINSVTTAHLGVVYAQRPGELGNDHELLENVVGTLSGAVNLFPTASQPEDDSEEVNVNVATPADFGIDEAYITFHDCGSPFYLQAGKKFTSFGNYNPYAITYSLTQLLTQTDEEVLQFGYISNDGLHASIYAFNGPFSGSVSNAENLTSRINNYGLDFGYSAQYDNINYNLGAGYVKDIRDSSFLSHRIANNFLFVTTLPISGFPVASGDLIPSQSAAGYELHADMNNGPLALTADYVAAVRGIFNTNAINSNLNSNVDSRVWAYGLEAGYGFDSMSYASKASLGYQRSGNASLLAVPRYRFLADYTVEVSKNAKITLEYTHSRDYKASDFGVRNVPLSGSGPDDGKGFATNNTTNTATLRIGVDI